MSLIDRIDQELATAMREGIASRTAVLRLLKNGIKNEQIKLGHELSEAETIKVLQKEGKQRKDSIEAYKQGGRQDLADSEAAELTVIEEFLPEQMNEQELSKIVEEVIGETGAADMTQMGVVIGAVMQRVGGKADGANVSRLVKEKLSK
jgi:uncharacterized protein YqeY